MKMKTDTFLIRVRSFSQNVRTLRINTKSKVVQNPHITMVLSESVNFARRLSTSNENDMLQERVTGEL